MRKYKCFHNVFFLIKLFSCKGNHSFEILLIFGKNVHCLRGMEVIQRAVSVADVHIFSRQNTLPDIFFGSRRPHLPGNLPGQGGWRWPTKCASGSMCIVAFHFICRKQMRFRFVLHLQQIIHPASVKNGLP